MDYYDFDHSLFLWLNFDGGGFMDNLMLLASGKLTWAPLYLLILFVVWRRRGWRVLLAFVACTVAALVLADLVSGIFKHSGPLKHLWESFPARLRPMHTEALQGSMHVIKGGSRYGTVSGHAGTTTAIAVLSSVAARRYWLTTVMAAYVAIICYSRIYLAYHFPMDICLGIVTGCLCAGIMVPIYLRLEKFLLSLPHKNNTDKQ